MDGSFFVLSKPCRLLFLLTHQRGISEKLLEGVDPQFAVDVLIMRIDRTFFYGGNFGDLLDFQSVQIISGAPLSKNPSQVERVSYVTSVSAEKRSNCEPLTKRA